MALAAVHHALTWRTPAELGTGLTLVAGKVNRRLQNQFLAPLRGMNAELLPPWKEPEGLSKRMVFWAPRLAAGRMTTSADTDDSSDFCGDIIDVQGLQIAAGLAAVHTALTASPLPRPAVGTDASTAAGLTILVGEGPSRGTHKGSAANTPNTPNTPTTPTTPNTPNALGAAVRALLAHPRYAALGAARDKIEPGRIVIDGQALGEWRSVWADARDNPPVYPSM